MQAALTDHLPGLDGALSPPLHNAGKLPLTGARDSQTYFGNACAKDGKQGGTLRYTLTPPLQLKVFRFPSRLLSVMPGRYLSLGYLPSYPC